MTTTISRAVTGPCGDTMRINLITDATRISDLSCETNGCAASWTALCTCCHLAKGMDLRQAARCIRPDRIIDACQLPPDHRHCARLAVCTLRAAIDAALDECAHFVSNCCDSDCDGAGSDCSGCTRKNPPADHIGDVLLVMAGKGGVGKSSVASGLASALAARDLRVGLLDADVHGPGLPRLLGLRGDTLCQSGKTLYPQLSCGGVHCCSSGLLVEHDQAIIRRGPAKSGLITSMINDIAWGHVDMLVVDLPPGTGDEALVVAERFSGRAKALMVTTPHELALDDAQRCLTFCSKLDLPVLGIVENMAGFRCPDCNTTHDIFAGTAATVLAERSGTPVLGRLPLDPVLAQTGEPAWSRDADLAGIAELLSKDFVHETRTSGVA
ncbi:MAG: P-loop NTPase [Planctomycetota bacterium]